MSKIQMRQGNYKKKAIFFEKSGEKICGIKNSLYLCIAFGNETGV